MKFCTFDLMMKGISEHIEEIRKLCRTGHIKSLFAFGSVTTDRFRPDSDIDLLVEIDESDPLRYSDSYFNLKFRLEQLLERRIDLLEKKAIRNLYLIKQIDQTKVLIYGK